jgi:hypothetical protein
MSSDYIKLYCEALMMSMVGQFFGMLLDWT